MKVINKTKYRTDDLRKFVYWVAKQEGYESKYTKRLRVYVDSAHRWHSGDAPLGGRHITIRIPKPDVLNKPRLASLIAHEMRHNHQRRGESFKPYSTERQMRGNGRYSGRNGSPMKYWAEAQGMELRLVEPKAKKVKGPHDRAVEGQSKAAKKVAEYERKLKRQQNLLKKWQKKLRYYDKRVDVTKDLPPPQSREQGEKKPRKPQQLVERDGEDIIVTVSGAAYGEVYCVEVDTFESVTPDDYGDPVGFRERKAFCEAMEKAEKLGKKQHRCRIRLSPDAARYFASADVSGMWHEEHPAATRNFEDRQEEVTRLLEKKAADESGEEGK